MARRLQPTTLLVALGAAAIVAASLLTTKLMEIVVGVVTPAVVRPVIALQGALASFLL